MNKKHIVIKNPDFTCCNCLKEGNIHKIHIEEMGYGSNFDGWSTQINLCDECLKNTNPEWWKFKTKIAFSYDDYGFSCYEYEDEIFDFVNKMPIEGQELFWNKYSTGNYIMDSQDWIDYQLNILPHEKCKEYGMYSPQEIQAYQDRFPNCKHVEIKVYGDGSSHSVCFRKAFGDKDGKCSENISSECYMCDMFKERTGELKVVDVVDEFYKRETERLQAMISYATNRLEMIKNKTLKEDEY